MILVVPIMEVATPRTSDGAFDDRSALRRALTEHGASAEDSAFWCAAWEAEAKRQGLRTHSKHFWDAGRGWIDAQRAFGEDEAA